jgi:hypothetical protein
MRWPTTQAISDRGERKTCDYLLLYPMNTNWVNGSLSLQNVIRNQKHRALKTKESTQIGM